MNSSILLVATRRKNVMNYYEEFKNAYEADDTNRLFEESVIEALLEEHQKRKEHLQFIYDRLVNVHGENPLYDYMWKLKEIIDKM